MKTSISIASIILLAALFSCNSNTENPTPKIEFEKKIKFSSTISLWNQPTAVNQINSKDKKRTYYSSPGVSNSNKLVNFQLEMSHIAIQSSDKSLRIEDGTFEILGKDGHSIYGTYKGYGEHSQSTPNLDLLVKVTGGTGYYTNAGGYLEIKTKEYPSQPSAFELDLAGFIIRDKQSILP